MDPKFFWNIDSKINVDGRWAYSVFALSTDLAAVFATTPIFYVNPKTMDTIYPPQRRSLLDENEVKKQFDTRFSPERNSSDEPISVDELWDELEKCSKVSKTFVAFGVFTHDIRPLDLSLPEDGTSQRPVRGIFLCPERILEAASSTEFQSISLQKRQRALFTLILVHELMHATARKPNSYYSTPWGRLIEESLANAEALNFIRRCRGNKSMAVAQEFCLGQPLEYSSYTYWFRPDAYWHRHEPYWHRRNPYWYIPDFNAWRYFSIIPLPFWRYL